jgi:hypothetical protein
MAAPLRLSTASSAGERSTLLRWLAPDRACLTAINRPPRLIWIMRPRTAAKPTPSGSPKMAVTTNTMTSSQ